MAIMIICCFQFLRCTKQSKASCGFVNKLPPRHIVSMQTPCFILSLLLFHCSLHLELLIAHSDQRLHANLSFKLCMGREVTCNDDNSSDTRSVDLLVVIVKFIGTIWTEPCIKNEFGKI